MKPIQAFLIWLLVVAMRAMAQEPVRIDVVMPSAAQLGGGWTSNCVVVQVDSVRPPNEICNEDAVWLKAAHNVVSRRGCNSCCVCRYIWSGLDWIYVWGSRYERAQDIGDDWGKGRGGWRKELKPEPLLDNLPNIGDEVRFHQRDGMHNNITFRRGKFIFDVEGGGATSRLIPRLKELAEAIDKLLVKKLADQEKGPSAESKK